jgi:hypothetical protein
VAQHEANRWRQHNDSPQTKQQAMTSIAYAPQSHDGQCKYLMIVY